MDKNYTDLEDEIIKEIDIILNSYTIGELSFYRTVNSSKSYDYNYYNLLIIFKENEKINKECGYNADGLRIDNKLLKNIILI